jgi:hypothetical protein
MSKYAGIHIGLVLGYHSKKVDPSKALYALR